MENRGPEDADLSIIVFFGFFGLFGFFGFLVFDVETVYKHLWCL